MKNHPKNRWQDSVAKTLDPVARLVYRSNLIGEDPTLTNTGGGNTSSKIKETDPLTGQETEVMWVKGSGGDLRTAKRDGFSSLYMEKLKGLQKNYLGSKTKGPKTQIEDDMVGAYAHCTFNLNPRPSSIDTPLHGFVPARHVDHTHPNAAISLAACAKGKELTKEIYGDEVIWTEWQRPGFDLGLILEKLCKDHPKARGAIMGQHGLINWHEDDKKCYELTLELVGRAAEAIAKKDRGEKTFGGEKYKSPGEKERKALWLSILPWLRGKVSAQQRMIGTVQEDATILRFVNSKDAPRLAEMGTSCPDHFLRTKIKPLYVAWDPATGDVAKLRSLLEEGLEAYRADYKKYYEKCKRKDSPAMRDPNPTVVLIPGLGMVAWGKSKSESRVTAEFYNCAVEVMRGAEALGGYINLPQQEAFDIEYWQLEEAKLRRMPPEQELARQVIAVVGAGSGIGKETAHRLSKEGASIVCVDLNEKAAQETSAELVKKLGEGIGVSGTGISGCGPAIGVGANIVDRKSVAEMLGEAVYAYGGIDGVVVTAGIFVPPDLEGRIPDEKWAQTFAINVTGSYVVADEANKIFKAQGLAASLVLTTSVNAVVAKKGSLAYDTSKAAANHLVRELAIELSPLVRVNAVAPATVVQGSAMFPRDRVMASLAKYKISFSEKEGDEELRTRLAEFYAKRTLTQSPITPADQAEAAFLLVSGKRFPRTTGQVIHVDGGLADGFLR
ncbi:MAG: bifunctional rhamnulose-1-phosphate aldolase/short-chain dehydrogenase [Candidatus Pacebacteria bacterium]|nr:bifunctional rhamnulose-1-phosphate aldolase/short-chain dehydrogenase [Candidatus Paceibacterota bacterium]